MADTDRPTVHADADRPRTEHPHTEHPDTGRPAARSRRDPVLLVAGVVALVVAAVAVLAPGLFVTVDPRWVLAAAALVTGVAVLATTVRRRR